MSTSTAPIPAFVYWPEPSPTSKYNINLRYYIISGTGDESTAEWDIGPHYEQSLELLYEVMLEAGNTQTPKEFEKFIRTLMEARLGFMVGAATYPAILSLLLGDGDALFDDMVRQTSMMVGLHNRLAKKTGEPLQHNPLKPTSFWKKMFN